MCYDKANVLRVEVTIDDPAQFRVLGDNSGHRTWCAMRKAIANLHRYFEVGRAANEHCLEALGAATDNTDATRITDRHCRPIRSRGRQHPRLNPVGNHDLALFRAAHAGGTPSTGPATETCRTASTRARRSTAPRPSAAAPRRLASSSSSKAMGWSPRSPGGAFTPSLPTAGASCRQPSPRTTSTSHPPTRKPPPGPSLHLQHSRGPRTSCGGAAQTFLAVIRRYVEGSGECRASQRGRRPPSHRREPCGLLRA